MGVNFSDASLKENVRDIEDALSVIERIRPVEFTFKGDGTESAGVIAQELEGVTPQFVRGLDKGILGVDYVALVGYLLAVVKELAKRLPKED